MAANEGRVADGVGDEGERSTEGDKARLFVELRQRQLGAFTRAQAMEHGITDRTLSGRCRRRQIQRVYAGVYLDFTGPIPWASRVWAAWLACGPDAVLTGATALRQFGLDGDWSDEHVHIAVPHSRRLDRRPGVV
ncbi:MAG TPA: type IV toxin-antitoxin system AbiEi family antitoxin domain-containing protein, partial [Streptomyces sp.]|nr:type IV toxin-antitoxin system AbiEi family antitoxin domain-containing protein [Streptomyces sp.]